MTNTFTYNGLGLRVGKVDSTGSYLYVCDGTSPGAPVLIDGHTLYTPGLSENRGGTSVYYDFDRIGNLWTVDGTGKSQLSYEDFSGFGGITASGGANPSPFKFSGGNGCQTDADTGLVLMGHRYYDGRQGRFISQDPAGDGDNWYAYAGNNPVNNIDPTGLYVFVDPAMAGTSGDPSQFDHSGDAANGSAGTWDEYYSNGKGGWTYLNTVVHGGLWDQMNMGGGGMGPSAGFMLPARPQPQYHPSPFEQFLHHMFQAATHPISPIPGVGPPGKDVLSKLSKDDLKKMLWKNDPNANYKQFFGNAKTPADPSAGKKISTEGLEAYRELAQRNIDSGLDKSGVQASRINLINQELSGR